MIITIAILLSILAGLFMSVRLYLISRKSGNATSQSHAILSGSMILGAGTVLLAYFILKGEGWTEDNRTQFYQFGSIALMIGFVIFGLRLLLAGRKQKSLLTQIMGGAWIIGALVIGIKSYQFGGQLNDGWSPEKRAKITAKCDPTTTNCQCFLKQTMAYFKSVEDYTETLSNEKDNQAKIDQYYTIIDTACACGAVQNDVEEVELPF